MSLVPGQDSEEGMEEDRAGAGQTGADQAGLFAAKDCGIQTGGWAPKGWKTKAGPAPWLAEYGLKEADSGYRDRTRINVASSDATIRLAYNFNSPGEKCTLTACHYFSVPHTDVKLYHFDYLIMWEMAVKFFTDISYQIGRPIVLNVAGNTERADGMVELRAYHFLHMVFNMLAQPESEEDNENHSGD